ncbi:MAG: hypothetical protein ACK52I_26160 [Pseudomonadota bacterium]
MNALMQWSLVGLAVLVAAGYALTVLMPRGWRGWLADALRRCGATGLASSLETGHGCDACSAAKTLAPKSGCR